MAGMLPGVEAARRRRFHKTSHASNSDNNHGSVDQLQATSSLRRYSFCLYATAHDHHSNSTMTRNPSVRQESRIMCDESRLSAAAREAKKRLDERLQLPRSQNNNNRPNVESILQHKKVPNLKRSGLKRLSWLKLRWKSSEQDECAVCLEHLRSRPNWTLMQLPCGHRFHTNCLLPWLEANAHCPCCRLEIPSS